LGQLSGRAFDGDETSFSNEERSRIAFKNNRIHFHAAVQLNYTTYDVRRDQDYVNPNTSHCDIMLASAEDQGLRTSHQYWYARVVKVIHVDVYRTSDYIPKPTRMDILWVRWFGRDPEYAGGFKKQRLDRVGFVPKGQGAFGLVDPREVIRACHLIPAFNDGRTRSLLRRSALAQDPAGDWQYFFVAR
jgi:hypothetical protein